MNIPFVNLADTQCWMLFLMPFGEEKRKDYYLVNQFQQSCVKRNLFGMGWCESELDDLFVEGTEISKQGANLFFQKLKEVYKKNGWSLGESGLKTALDNYQKIKPGDYIMSRLKNGHYIIGKVNTKITFLQNKNDKCGQYLSWGGYVEEYVEFDNDSELPSELVGRLSSRYNKTIEVNNWYRQNILIIYAYEKRAKYKNDRFQKLPKLVLTENNLARSLDYMGLEDAVNVYIHKQHSSDGYYLLPSSCKLSQKNYEFMFISKGKKPITCQVKNQNDEIKLDLYKNETSFEKIYIFSGKWCDDAVDELNEEYKKQNPSIHIIKPSELFKAVKESGLFNLEYLDTNRSLRCINDFQLDNMRLVNSFRSISHDNYHTRKDTYKVDSDYITFMNNNLFYSFEFDALILKNHFCTDRKLELKCVKYVNDYLLNCNP